jgi:hypothetical protein
METLTLVHEEVMQEEKLRYSDLPIDIQEDINELEELKSEYNDSPSEQGRNILIKESIQIADDIQDWLEKDLDEDEENPNSFVENINENNSSSKPNWKFW